MLAIQDQDHHTKSRPWLAEVIAAFVPQAQSPEMLGKFLLLAAMRGRTLCWFRHFVANGTT